MIKFIKQYLTDKMARAICILLERQDIRNNINILFNQILTDDKSKEIISEIIGKKEIHEQFWKSANIRPVETQEFSYAAFPNDLTEESFRLAAKHSAEYIHDKMVHLYGIPSPMDVLSTCINEIKLDGLFLEFGVFSGNSINHIASKTEKIVHGFDSFQGIPEAWNSVPEGTFSTDGKLPSVAKNVQLHVGYFEDTLSPFKNEFSDDVAFLHIDSDLYSSAHTVLFSLQKRIKQGTIIVFDEYFNYPGWKEHEYLAFQEFISETGLQYEYIAFCSKGFSVGVRIL